MQRIFQILFSLLVISGLAFAQNMSKDLTKTPTNFNNPEYVYGPELENPTLGFAESFEGTTFPPAGWLKANPDGGTGWSRELDGTTPIPGWTGGTITVPTGGGSAVAFCTWTTGGATANDQWLITPQITNVQSGDMLTFWLRVFANDSYAENFDIRISTTGTNIANFTTVVQAFVWPVGGVLDEWISYSYDLINYVPAGSNIYIAFREHVTDNLNDGAAVLLDLVEVTQGGGSNTYFEDFETFVAGQQLACQDPTNWTTWSNAPCGNEDALISTNYAFSGTKSALIDWVAPRYVDLVKPFGGKTTGTWYVDFMAYIPAGKYGYYNILADFAGASSLWAFQAYFNAGGTGTIDAGGASAATFTYPHDAWFAVQFKVDLDADQAQFWVNGTSVYTWQYTLGTFGTPVPKVLDASDIFAPNAVAANNAMYIDNFYFSDQPFIPVELTSFTANVNNLGQVVLNWETATEVNNHMFEIERRSETSEYRTIGFVEGFGTTTEPKSYIYTDVTAENGINYYRLKQVDFNGTYEYSDEIEIDVNGPLTFDLAQNYPNPFNPSTSIKYSVPESGNIRLSVFNIVGEEVAVLVDGFNQAGFYEVAFDASNLPSGVYVYKLQSANSVQAKKMMLLK